MPVFTKYLEYSTKGNSDIIDITDDVIRSVSESAINDGIVTVFAAGSTVAVTTLEFELGLVHDLQQALERLAPQNMDYKHNERWHDGNGHSHVRASLLGQSESFPLIGGKLLLGTWQQVIFIDLDNKPRSRKLVVQIVGE